LKSLLANTDEPTVEISRTVESILTDVRARGDEALLEYTNRFDDRDASIEDLEIPVTELEAAVAAIPDELRQGLEHAATRVRDYHERQITESWLYKDKEGNTLGQQVTPLDSVGIYVPGGKAAYPSSVIMNAIPAHVAGVSEIIMVVPMPKGEKNQMVLAAAAISGVSKVFSIGGAQAIAALAYGTASVPKVDKIVGPGNIYVATAKRQVFGTVGIDMIAGPSEVLIVSDGESNPDWVAMDLFAQAEHDEEACAILLCPKIEFLDAVEESINRLLPEMERREVIKSSLEKNGALILVEDIDEAIDLVNQVAPEHLELSMTAPEPILPRIRHAGAIFMGHYAAEALGDYCAGPNHVLPTARTARFSSPLGVYDFQKRSSVIICTEQSASTLASTASVLARGEGLTAHARSAEYRIKS
ncbi:MAG: histidinol dehydrogenase, partial [Gammaproteobacteria bacterium]|nr:histidinol dehydrogenase [Gammaproteobacteria bacterium]